MSVFKAAAVQMRSGTDIGRNASAMEALVREAAGQGAVYVQTPEMTGALMKETRGLGVIFKSSRSEAFSACRSRACRSQSCSAWFSSRSASTWDLSAK